MPDKIEKKISYSDVQGIVYKDGGKIVRTAPRSQIPKLDVISACEDLAAAEYELSDDDDRNYLLKKYISNI